MNASARVPVTVEVSDRITVPGIVWTPRLVRAAYVFAHGAGAGMRHPFMEGMAERLATHAIATLRYQFPYAEAGRARPDLRPVLLATVRAAVRACASMFPGLPLFAGGKSMGGRMTSLAASEAELPGVRGIAFLGFPLHPAGKAGVERAEHLTRVGVPMLFLQGTRDDLCDLALLRPICEQLYRTATLHVVEGADHGFHVLRRSGRSDDEVVDELAGTIADWSTAFA